MLPSRSTETGFYATRPSEYDQKLLDLAARYKTTSLHSTLKGVASILAATWLLIASVLGVLDSINAWANRTHGRFEFMLAIAAFCGAAKYFLIGRRYLAPSAFQVLCRDPRPPVLYLRPFMADVANEQSWNARFLGTDEQRLVRQFRRLGPVLCIGDPLERLPDLGATRIYVPNEEWQQVAEQLATASQIVVFNCSRSVDSVWHVASGLLWELDACIQRAGAQRLILAVPFSGATYSAFRDATAMLLPSDLPELPPGQPPFYITFDSDALARIHRTPAAAIAAVRDGLLAADCPDNAATPIR